MNPTSHFNRRELPLTNGAVSFPDGTSWIQSPVCGGPCTTAPVPYFRRDFEIVGKIQSAVLTITALGLYEAECNGHCVHDDVFSPGWTDYRKRVYVRQYDLSASLVSGKNTIGVILGDGWYCGYLSSGHRQFYGDRPRFIACLSWTTTDGTSGSIQTGPEWKTSTGPILESDFFMGEAYDARRECLGWSLPDFDDAAWTHAQIADTPQLGIVASIAPPIKRMEFFDARRLDRSKPVDTQTLWDIGQNIAGRVRVHMRGNPGTTVKIRHAEMLDANGEPYFGNLRTARSTDCYTFKDDEPVVWEPRFTVHGFRYVQMTGQAHETLEISKVEGISLYSEMRETGDFTCSDDLLNKLYCNIVRSQKGNFLDIPTDCPQRDERLGWTGDAQVFIRTALHNLDAHAFFRKWMQDLIDAQRDSGEIPCTAPNIDAFGHKWDGGAAWSDAVFICPWTLYEVYGDSEILARCWDMMVRYMDFIAKAPSTCQHIRVHSEKDPWGGFGDWLAPARKGKSAGSTPKDLIATAFYANNARILARIAEVLGRESDVKKWTDLANAIAAAFRRRFVSEEGLVTANTQTACVLALYFDILLPEQRTVAASQLVGLIRANDNYLSTGFIGTSYLLPVLESEGYLETAYRLLENKECPSWLYAVVHGATSIWERWDGWTAENGFADPGMNSYNHYAYGAVGAWMVGTVAGLSLDAPGFGKILFKPRPGGSIRSASTHFHTSQGKAAIAWQLNEAGQLFLQLTVPEGSTARIDLDSRWLITAPATLPPGDHRLVAEPNG